MHKKILLLLILQVISCGHDLENSENDRGMIDTYDYGKQSSNWSGWSVVGGGQILGAPCAVSLQENELFVFARGASNDLITRSWSPNNGWSSWRSLGGALASSPTAASANAGQIDVFVEWQDHTLYNIHYNWGTWQGWRPMNGQIRSAPSAISKASGQLDVFARGPDDSLYALWWNSSQGWSSWYSLGGVISSAPSAASKEYMQIDVFARGSDGMMQGKWWNTSEGWSGWYGLGGPIDDAPSVVSKTKMELDVFAKYGTNMITKWWNRSHGWIGWRPMGGALLSSPASVSKHDSTIDVFVQGSDRQLWQISYEEPPICPSNPGGLPIRFPFCAYCSNGHKIPVQMQACTWQIAQPLTVSQYRTCAIVSGTCP